MRGSRWIVVVGALLVACLAFFVLFRWDGSDRVGPGRTLRSAASDERSAPALDDIDAKSRAAMRDLLREAGDEE